MFRLLTTGIQLIILGIQFPKSSEDVFKLHTEGPQICNFPVPFSRRKMETQAVATRDARDTGPFSKTRTVSIPCLSFTLHRVSSTRELELQDCASYGSDSSCFYTVWNDQLWSLLIPYWCGQTGTCQWHREGRNIWAWAECGTFLPSWAHTPKVKRIRNIRDPL